ncbi:AAA domain-containing protein [Schinkia azotoformans]|uniref:AAA domain-containing protein n=1 Tax=Schinkia azotoformans TaxID=1454 RepID=UPI002DB70DBC|nr:AAA domain-containing protein [Schinkia azotoformans]MEC1717024.1 AAA domain-containing protein [Schinkia azotoformans]MEC1741328.1 AAA domain-containing protein [Schinkia azotoformans]MEC1747481.1 AAA domain-containing protein [Schinkia azotoformans]MEC1758079.1 AAA domain-containing protein [Schinkia azotoformans]MEC1769178.1 AAA domain-containing protein [Schinkia azotoformans]
MTTTKTYIKEWQQALHQEINYLKKFGGSRYSVTNGRLLSNDGTYSYYFDTAFSLKIPVGSSIKLEWGTMKGTGRVLSSEGRGVILAIEQNFGDLIQDAFLLHDPWELLEQLIERLDEIKKSKQKRLRVKRLMNPSMETKHPVAKIKSNVHELVLRSKYNPVTFVWGPPGTGKTYTLARTAANKYIQNKKVLVLSHSNQAVDVLMGELTDFIKKKKRFQEGDVLRYGGNIGDTLSTHQEITTNLLIEKQDPLLAKERDRLMEDRRHLKQDLAHSFSKRDSDHLLELEIKIARVLEKVREKEVELVKDALIIGTTLAKAASDSAVYEREYDVVIIDEASMAYVPQVAFAGALGKRVIICGDFKQLPPIASSRDIFVAKWLKEDVFHHAGMVDWLHEGKLHPQLFLLKEQRRMHPDISEFTNRYIYQSLVGDHESVNKSRNKIVSQTPFKDHAAVLLDTSFTGLHCMNDKSTNSRFNLWQLLLSFQLMNEAYASGAKSIGYVTPYRAQANLMELLLEEIYEKERSYADIIAATVHRFQGSERDVMIFDTVDCDPQDRVGMLLIGKDSERLINVAITRTKGKFIHVSNRNFIEKHIYQGKTLRQLVDHQVRNKQGVTTKDIGSWIRNQHSKLRWIHARKLEGVFQDLQSAKSSITISLPMGTNLQEEWKKQLLNKEKRVKLTIISDRFPFPFVMIDEKVLWLGLPLEGARRVQPPYVAARLSSSQVCEYLLKQI